MLAALLIGGFAVAAALMLRSGDEPTSEDAPVARSASNSPRPVLQPAVTAQPERQVARNDSPAAQPQAQEPEAKDIPLALVTTSLTRPLAEALAERLGKHYGLAQPRVMTMDDYEAFRALCANADFVMASRRIDDVELANCRKWGIDVVEWKLGYQAVVLTAGPSADPVTLTPREVFLALARRIPDRVRSYAADRQSELDLARRRPSLRLSQHRRAGASQRHDPRDVRATRHGGRMRHVSMDPRSARQRSTAL